MNFSEFLDSHKGKKVVVCGVGTSNRPLIRLLRSHGIAVSARDRNGLGDYEAELSAMDVPLITGENYLENIDADIVYRSPGLHPLLLEDAVRRGACLTSEMEAFFEVCPCEVIAVTGSDGKTTTSTLIAEILSADGKTVYLGGNIGTPLLDRVPQMAEDGYAVVELSSFQLMTMTQSAPRIVVTNVTPNHLDMHTSLEEYIGAKRNIITHQPGGGIAVLNYDNEVTRSFAGDSGSVRWFSMAQRLSDGVYFNGTHIVRVSDGAETLIVAQDGIRIPGRHNIENYMAATAIVDGIVSDDSIRRVAREFGGVAHRIEFVRELDGVKWYNDSMSSSPTRGVAGLKAFDHKVVLIAGGYDKQIPFEPLCELLPERASTVVLMGATAQKIRKTAERYDGCPRLLDASALDEAVRLAREAALRDGSGTVLFSPSCASFDMFKNYAERGDTFKRIVGGLA